LLAPSEELYQLCACFEKVVQMNLEKLIFGRNVKSNLKDCFEASVDQHSFSLDFACDKWLIYLFPLFFERTVNERVVFSTQPNIDPAVLTRHENLLSQNNNVLNVIF
jgi:hypothetical protein